MVLERLADFTEGDFLRQRPPAVSLKTRPSDLVGFSRCCSPIGCGNYREASHFLASQNWINGGIVSSGIVGKRKQRGYVYRNKFSQVVRRTQLVPLGGDIHVDARARIRSRYSITIAVERGTCGLAHHREFCVLQKRIEQHDSCAEGFASGQKVEFAPRSVVLAANELVNRGRYLAAVAAEVIA